LRYRLSLERQDEIGKLASAFNHMADDLEQARDEITGWNRELERRVEEKSAELARAQQRLVHSEKLASLGQMAAAVAHEINNPLAGILTYARLLEKKIAADGEIHSWLEIIQRESKRCGQIAGNLLAFARNKPVEMATASINAIVERALAVVQHQLGLQQIELETELEPDLPAVDCDASQIEQVVMALVMNAVESMAGGGRLRVHTRRAGPEHVEIAVSDNGPPIPAEALQRLFEPFFTTKQTTGGAGLGLAVSYGIVRRHGGEILVETGAETTFRVRLPLRGDAS
jgi:two-component system NtrC family sensor kinase